MAKQAKQKAGKAAQITAAATANFNELRQRANKGDLDAQARLCRALDETPAIWRRLGDMGQHAQLQFIRLIAGNDFLLAESLRRRMAEFRTELLGVFPSGLEVMAVDRVCAARAYLEHVEAQCAKAEAEIPIAKFWMSRQRQAHNLYHNAVKSLLLIRTLLPPEGPPAALTANGTATTKLNGKGRLGIGVNGDGSSLCPTTGAANRLNGASKNTKPKALATA